MNIKACSQIILFCNLKIIKKIILFLIICKAKSLKEAFIIGQDKFITQLFNKKKDLLKPNKFNQEAIPIITEIIIFKNKIKLLTLQFLILIILKEFLITLEFIKCKIPCPSYTMKMELILMTIIILI